MSRSAPPRSNSAGSPTPDDPAAAARAAAAKRWKGKVAAVSRWLHIYLSMFGLVAVLFFSVTGLTLNHPDWTLGPVEGTTEAEGSLSPSLLGGGSEGGEVDRLAVVEHLRSTHGVRGAVAEFRVDDLECMVTFKGPGYSADAFIDRETGHYDLTQTAAGLLAILNDLHKGRDTGPVWSVVVDVSAIALVIISLSGLILLFYLKRRRRRGLIVSLAGMVVIAVIAMLWAP